MYSERNRKRLGTALLLACVMAAGVLGVGLLYEDGTSVSDADTAHEGDWGSLHWVLDTDGNLTVTGTGVMNAFKSNSTDAWLAHKADIKTVTVEDGITSISSYAFYKCIALTTISLPDGVTSIGNSAFSGCTSLESVTLPDSVTSIGNRTFGGCTSLESVTLLGVTCLPDYVFTGCTSLTSVTLGKDFNSLSDWAFYRCTALSSVTVSDENTKYNSVDGVVFSDNGLALYPAGKTDISYSVPDNVTSIWWSAFGECVFLESVTIPDSVTSIGEYSFRNCTSLKTVTIGKGVTDLSTRGNKAFNGCTSLESVTVSDENPAYCSVGGVLFSKDMTELVLYPCKNTDGSYTIPDGVVSIGINAFNRFISLKTLSIPSSVTSINAIAFNGLQFLDSSELLALNKTADYLAGHTWTHQIGEILTAKVLSNVDGVIFAKNMTEVFRYTADAPASAYIIPDGVTSIGDGAFKDAAPLSLTIPKSVAVISDVAFPNLYFTDLSTETSLDKTVENLAGYTWIDTGYKGFVKDSEAIVVDNVVYSKDMTKLYNGKLAPSDYVIPDSVTAITTKAFKDATLTSVTIPDSVTYMEGQAFGDLSFIDDLSSGSQTVENPAGHTWVRVGSLGFVKDSEVIIEGGVVFSKDKSVLYWYGTSASPDYIIPDGVTTIASGAFMNYASVNSLTIPDSVKNIESGAFPTAFLNRNGIIEATAENLAGHTWACWKQGGNTVSFSFIDEGSIEDVSVKQGDSYTLTPPSETVRVDVNHGKEWAYSTLTPQDNTWLDFGNNTTFALIREDDGTFRLEVSLDAPVGDEYRLVVVVMIINSPSEMIPEYNFIRFTVTPHPYILTFTADGKTVGTVEFVPGDESADAPAVPAKTGYSGAWGAYDLTLAQNQIVSAVYTPNVYTLTFVADGIAVGTVEYTYGAESVEVPAVPAKEGYTGEWGSYSLALAEDQTVNAVYTEAPPSDDGKDDTAVIICSAFICIGAILAAAGFLFGNVRILAIGAFVAFLSAIAGFGPF